jgi:hypothetical protein
MLIEQYKYMYGIRREEENAHQYNMLFTRPNDQRTQKIDPESGMS